MKIVVRILGAILVLATLTAVLAPLAWVLLSSLKPGSEILGSPWSMPKSAHLVNYSNAWTLANIGQYFLNSLLVSAGTIVVLIPISAMAAYVIAKMPFRGSQGLYGAFSAGMMVPQFLTIVPLFLLMANLRLVDTKIGLVLVYIAYSLPFTVFVLTGFFQTLPSELMEASALDGASHHRTFWKVMLPLGKPGLMVAVLFNAIGLWNEYTLALVLVSSEENRTLPIGLGKLTMTQQYQGDWGALFAGMVIVMAPILALYIAFRDRIHQSMLAGAIKG